MHHSFNRALITLLIFISSAPIFAAQGQFYALAGIGNTTIDDSESGFHYKATSNSYKLGAGFSITDNIAIEGYYTDIAEADDTVNGMKIKESANGLAGAIVSSVNLSEPFSLFAKLGIISWHATAKSMSGSIKDDGSDLTYGIGGAYNFNSEMGLRLEFEKADFNGVSVETLSANILYHFN